MIGGTAPMSTSLATRPCAVAGDIAGRLAAAGGVADVDGVAQVEMLDDGGDVGGVVVHVVAAADLARPPMAAPVMGDDAVALLDEVEQLRIPVVSCSGASHDARRSAARSPSPCNRSPFRLWS